MLKSVVVGSVALKEAGIHLREPNDVDIWCELPMEGYHPTSLGRVEYSVMPAHILSLIPTNNGFATPDAVYTIKCSHAAWDIKWDKTKNDIIALKFAGCRLLPKLYEKLLTYWKELHGNKDFLSLNKGRKDFFNDAVDYVYDHDYLHELVAYPNKPMYTRCLKDGHDVLFDKDKFDKLSFPDKVRMFREEIAVISLERWILNPKLGGRVSIPDAHKMALRKTVTSLTKGWASEFIILNLEHFYRLDFSYLNNALDKLKPKEESKTMSEVKNTEHFINQIKEFFKDSEYDTEDSIHWFVCEFLEYDITSDYINEKYPELADFVNDKGIKVLDVESGGEGMGEYCYIVFEWDGVIYRHVFAYYSHQGNEFYSNEFTPVTAKQKTITTYE